MSDEPYAADPLAAVEKRFRMMHKESRAFPPSTREERLDLLKRLREALVRGQADFTAALSADFGTRAPEETMMAEIMPCLMQIQHAMKHLKGWMKPERRTTAVNFWPGSSRIHYQPKGVVLIISPWNYPVQLTFGPVAAAIAAGNRVIVKPSELTPRTSAALKKHLEAMLGREHVTVATGGPEIAAGLSALPFDHILFTGSTAVGHKVMAAAAQHLTPVTLELGGKSPAIVHEAHDLKTAAERIVRGKLLNAGQTCIAPDYALVPQGRVDAFVDAYRTAAATFYPRIIDNGQYSAIVNARHFDRLTKLAGDARARGAQVHVVDPAQELPSGEVGSSNTRKIAPTLLTGVTDDMAIMQEEIFGPLLPVLPYGSLDDAIGYVNARPRPLALYYFDTDRSRINEVLARTTSGGASINDTLMHVAQEDIPFGGVGPSGMGAYHGREGFLTFSHAKGTFHQGRLSLASLVYPPYGERFQRIMKMAFARAGGRSTLRN